MINVKENFKNCHEKLICPCCLLESDSQKHLIFCSQLSGTLPEKKYNDIFGENEEKMEIPIKILQKSLKKELK